MADDETNRLSARVRRYARVSGTVGGFAARVVGGRLFGIERDRGVEASALKAAIGGLRGPLMKLAQIMATIPDALPAEYVEELKQLQANAPAMGWPFVRRRMASELGPGWQGRFREFGHVAAHAASLGQVHKAETHAGIEVACKLQYPDMASAVEADLRQLQIVFALYQRYDPAVRTDQIHAELTARLREELDYGREAAHMRLYRQMLVGQTGVHVPEPVAELSTGRLLTMTWLDGAPLLSMVGGPVELRNAIAQNMFRAWYVPFYEYGVIHGDPHLGNYTVLGDGAVNLLDFGCVRVFEPSFVKGVIDLYNALRDDDHDLAVQAYETWGFKGISREMIEVLNIWAEFVYAPLLEDKARRIQESESGLYGATVAAKVHRELRRLGGIQPPREFVLVDRAAIGLGSVFMHLKAEINWHQLFHELIQDFDVDAMAVRQRAALAGVGLGDPAPDQSSL
ncbi:MAG: AarF/ABC1/UbiB kinase family protein [Alphaproteobacteria bacterium]|nr:AarF/ABC1/UbiB kinase family protein [Alphaproteobacteria bacterium]